MAPKKENDDPRKKRIIEFDMFVRDLEPEQEICGGRKSGNQYNSIREPNFETGIQMQPFE